MWGNKANAEAIRQSELERWERQHEEWERRFKERCEQYPHTNDPRRDTDWGSRTTDSEMKQLLGAILDELYKINDRAAAGKTGVQK